MPLVIDEKKENKEEKKKENERVKTKKERNSLLYFLSLIFTGSKGRTAKKDKARQDQSQSSPFSRSKQRNIRIQYI